MGPITAAAIEAFAPPMATFSEGATLPPGSVSFRGDTRRAESRGWGVRQRWGSATSAGF